MISVLRCSGVSGRGGRRILSGGGMIVESCLAAVASTSPTPHHPLKESRAGYVRLAEVGRLETPKLDGKYETGQLFLHRVFGYRGVTLFPWKASVYDRDVPDTNTGKTSHHHHSTLPPNLTSTGSNGVGNSRHQDISSTNFSHVNRTVTGRAHTYYQVLIDVRDCPYVRTQTEAVTFLGHQDASSSGGNGNSRSLFAIPGLDYVAHEDILPYTSVDRQPIHHELFDKFLMYDPERDPPLAPRETLRQWQEKNHPWLELTDVYKETTEDIRVTVIPFYMGCRTSQNTTVYWWRYCIRLENLGELSVQLRERHWKIFSLTGTLETVRGRGVVGQEPILSKSQPAFQYSSHVSLHSPSGHMWGTFKMEREDGSMFDCRIPPFTLDGKHDNTVPPSSPSSPPDHHHHHPL